MGVLDKIKNALFEVEYVEVEEPPKKEKKAKIKEKKAPEVEKPIAKKVVLPGKRDEKVEKLEEEDVDNDIVVERKPSLEEEKREKFDAFEEMDDNDFKVEEDIPVKEETFERVEHVEGRRTRRDDFYESTVSNNDVVREEAKGVKEKPIQSYDNAHSNSDYGVNKETKENKLYGVDSSYSVPVHEYGTYEKKEEKSYFKPSPIISPIYGILDKNYRKEDVVQKKDIRLTTNYTRTNVSVDDVRDKAYGDVKKEETPVETVAPTRTFEVEDNEDENLLVDLSDRVKPEVKELTMGDAMEYFQDLGLEYNVDYVDASKQTGKHKETVEPKHEEKPIIHSHEENIVEEEIDKEVYSKPKLTSTIEVKDESKKVNAESDDDDNLFDLIDSMYQDQEDD